LMPGGARGEAGEWARLAVIHGLGAAGGRGASLEMVSDGDGYCDDMAQRRQDGEMST
jgi:hypothetical protein